MSLRYSEWIIYVFQYPIPSHQCSITLFCVRHGLFVSFISSIAIDKRARLTIIALNSPSQLSSFPQSMMFFISEVFMHLFKSIKSYEWVYYHTITPSASFILIINYFLPKLVSFLITWWRHRMTLCKVCNLFILWVYMFSFPIIIFAFTSTVSIYQYSLYL